MSSLRLVVTPRGDGYLAECRAPFVRAIGATVAEAADYAREAAIATLGDGSSLPEMLLVRIDQPGCRTLIMQPTREVVVFPAPERARAFHTDRLR